MFMKSTFPLSWIYIFIYIYIYVCMEIYIQFNKFELRVTMGFSERAESHESLSFFTFTSPARMVAISPCMKAQGTLEPTRGHFSPLGQ